MTTYGLLIFDGAEELDFVGPWQVFTASSRLRDVRYVVDGNVVTSQGVSAGIDMALWLVGRPHGRDHSRAVRRSIQYDPAPPYLADEPVTP